ncbi:MAG: hypothetical protein P1U86_11675 [Verrucomicrobiales bacterium]|nr:hypothetical protein [Verrucomicrobiales bacterium]
MRRALKNGLIVALVVTIAAGAIEAALAQTENDFFQFCTTKAYGWPAPWRIDYCECEGAKTVYPARSKVVNLFAIGGSGFLAFAFVSGLSLLRQRPR